MNDDLLLVDTSVSARPGAAFELAREPVADPRNALDRELVLRPTREGVVELVRALGYEAVVLRPAFSDYTGAADYEQGQRRGFLCAKRSSLVGFRAEP